jgi:SRSO17 transposase
MNRREITKLDRELREYIDSMVADMGRPERRRSMGWYVTGLLLDGDRKSIEPMASRLVDDDAEIQSMRQRLQECVTISAWSEIELLGRLARKLDGELPGVEALVVDDTGHPKKGKHSVGVARQYSGTLGRVDNCQIAVSLHLAGESVSGCIAYDLYLPDEWATNMERRRRAGVPDEIAFRPKWQIALRQIDDALRAGVRKHVVLADGGYGEITEFREGLAERGLSYVVGISGQPIVWPPESKPRPAAKKYAKGRTPTRFVDEDHPPIAVEELALRLEYRNVTWREGTRGWQRSRFATVRIRTAHRHYFGYPPSAEQWLLVEWPIDEKTPTRYWLAALPATASIRSLVRLAKLRWRVERDYQEMKQEIGLDHYEGRTWRGFHHHAALCAVAHGFLALKRALFPPEEDQMDAANGPPLLAADPPPTDRILPALSQTR